MALINTPEWWKRWKSKRLFTTICSFTRCSTNHLYMWRHYSIHDKYMRNSSLLKFIYLKIKVYYERQFICDRFLTISSHILNSVLNKMEKIIISMHIQNSVYKFCANMRYDTGCLGLTEVTPLMNQGLLIHFFDSLIA